MDTNVSNYQATADYSDDTDEENDEVRLRCATPKAFASGPQRQANETLMKPLQRFNASTI
jgi:hypothetical protein